MTVTIDNDELLMLQDSRFKVNNLDGRHPHKSRPGEMMHQVWVCRLHGADRSYLCDIVVPCTHFVGAEFVREYDGVCAMCIESHAQCDISFQGRTWWCMSSIVRQCGHARRRALLWGAPSVPVLASRCWHAGVSSRRGSVWRCPCRRRLPHTYYDTQSRLWYLASP